MSALSGCNKLFWQLTDQGCHHYLFSDNLPYFLIGSLTVVFGVCLTSATGLGPQGFQILFLLLVLKYGKGDSASFIHAMQAGLYLFNSLMNLRKHQDGLPIVNLRLALLLIPPMIAANNLGTLLKNFVPPIFSTLITFCLLLFQISVTLKKRKRSQIELLNKFNADEQKEMLIVGEGIEIDWEKLAANLNTHPNKEQILKSLPPDPLASQIVVGDEKMRLKDYLSRNPQQAHKLHKQVSRLPYPRKDMALIALIILFNILFSGSMEDNCNYVTILRRVVMNSLFFVFMYFYTDQSSPVFVAKIGGIALLQGVLFGFIGAGSQALFIFFLTGMDDIKLSMNAAASTIPLLMVGPAMVTGGSAIFYQHSYDPLGVVVVFALTLVVTWKIVPQVVRRLISPSFAIHSALIFQIGLLIAFCYVQVAKFQEGQFWSQLQFKQPCEKALFQAALKTGRKEADDAL